MSDIYLISVPHSSKFFENTSIVSKLSLNTSNRISKGKNGICKMKCLKLQLKIDFDHLVVYIFLFSYRGR